MYNKDALLELNVRVHKNLKDLLAHCENLSPDQMDKTMEGFGYNTVRQQLHHAIGGEKYWIGVLLGRIDVEENPEDCASVKALQGFREKIFMATQEYLKAASVEELNTARPMMTWGNKEKVLIPAHVFLRTQMHYYHHQGQVLAMCRLLNKPGGGMDYPIE